MPRSTIEALEDAFRNEIMTWADSKLEAEWIKYLEWEHDNDDEGGHVGLSRYYRQRAHIISQEQNRRKTMADENTNEIEIFLPSDVENSLREISMLHEKVYDRVHKLLDAMDKQHNGYFSQNVEAAREDLRELFPKYVSPSDLVVKDKDN